MAVVASEEHLCSAPLVRFQRELSFRMRRRNGVCWSHAAGQQRAPSYAIPVEPVPPRNLPFTLNLAAGESAAIEGP